MSIQLDFFEETDEITLLKKECQYLKERYDILRKSFFSRQAEQDKLMIRLWNEHEERLNRLVEMMIQEKNK